MNKKQKILPILALVAFSAVIALHYGSIGRERGHIEWTSMTAAEKAMAIKSGLKVTAFIQHRQSQTYSTSLTQNRRQMLLKE
jgi:hypothetical protein